MAFKLRFMLGAFAIGISAPSAEACSISNGGWPWDVAYLRKLWSEGLAQEPDEFVFAGKVTKVSKAPDRKTADGEPAPTELVDLDIVGVMRGNFPPHIKLLNIFKGGCGTDWETPPAGKLTFVMARRLDGSGELEATMFAVDEDALGLLIAFTNAGMRAKPPKP